MTRQTLGLFLALCGSPCFEHARRAPWTRQDCAAACAPNVDRCLVRFPRARRYCTRILVRACLAVGPRTCEMLFPTSGGGG